jgi:hypothetical protein
MPPKYRGGRGGGEGGGGGRGGGGQRGRGGRGGGRGGGPPGDSAPRTPSQAQPSRGGPPGARNVSQPPTSPPSGASVPTGPWAQPSQFPALPSQSAQSPPSQTVRSPPPAVRSPQAVQTAPAPQAPAQPAPQSMPRTRAAIESEDIVVFRFALFIDIRIFLLVLVMAKKVALSLCLRIISASQIFQMSKCTNTLSLSPPRMGTPQQRALQPPSGKALKSKQPLEQLTPV